MNTFRSILVGVEFDADGRIAEGCVRAIAQGMLLARQHDATLVFAHVVDLPESMRDVLDFEPQNPQAQWRRTVEARLDTLVADAQGIRASACVLFGKHWRALIEQVQQHDHDLVIVGTRGRNILRRMLLGSTGNRLLRYCPCPVLAVKPNAPTDWNDILVAHDLTPVGDKALRIAAALGHGKSTLHVLHALEHPEEHSFLGNIPQGEVKRRIDEARNKLAGICVQAAPDSHARVSVETGSAHVAIMDYVNTHPVDLLCLGTSARTGASGMLVGNTAECVLPWVECSLLAVKPDGFKPAL